MLDVDGLLLDFADENDVRAAVPKALQVVSGLQRVFQGALALFSARGLNDIDRLFGRLPCVVAASHGLELRHADGSFRRKEVSSDDHAHMRKVARQLERQLDDVRLDETQRTATLHCDTDGECLRALRTAVEALSTQLPGYDLKRGRHSVEFRPRGMDRGLAVREVLRHRAFTGKIPIYVGTGAADEQAFKRVNRACGNSILVGDYQPTLARYGLADASAARGWLGDVLEVLSKAHPRSSAPTARASAFAR